MQYRNARINPLMRKIRLRFKTHEGLQKYNQRFHKGEVAQAHIEHNLGYREFKCRGIDSCKNEVNLFSAAYNMKKIHIHLKKIKLSGSCLEISVQVVYCFFGIVRQPAKPTLSGFSAKIQLMENNSNVR